MSQLHLKNLNDVEEFLKANAPSYTVKRGQETIYDLKEHAENYEVLQVFRANQTRPFAEFWKGFYVFAPEGYSGHYTSLCCNPIGNKKFPYIGGLEDTMERVVTES